MAGSHHAAARRATGWQTHRGMLLVLPQWEPGTVAVLSTAAGPPHGIPVSTALRAGDCAVLLALAGHRESLRRLRADPRCALTLLAASDVAFTAHGRAAIVADPLPAVSQVVAVRIEVESVQDHRQDTFDVQMGVRWQWTDPEARERDARVRAGLAALLSGNAQDTPSDA
jgi:hypothetical protein